MGTRSTTVIKGDVWEVGKEAPTLVTLYRQFDGYPEGHGQELADIMRSKRVRNGLREEGSFANGMGCLAAQIIKGLKKEEGNIYIVPNGEREEEYHYIIYAKGIQPYPREGAEIFMTIKNDDKILYDGPVDEFDAKIV